MFKGNMGSASAAHVLFYATGSGEYGCVGPKWAKIYIPEVQNLLVYYFTVEWQSK